MASQGMDQLPNGHWLVTDRAGNLRIAQSDGTISKPITGMPDVDTQGQGGLLDVTVDDTFEETWLVFDSTGDLCVVIYV